MEVENIYDLVSKIKYDQYAFKHYFNLAQHQIIPKYYMLSNDNVNKLILHYSLGSGKTGAAVYLFLNNLDLYKMYNFNKQYAPSNSPFITKHKINQNVIVVGAWQTQAAVEAELMRPEFGQLTIERSEEILNMLSSTIESRRREGEETKLKVVKQISRDIKFQGYQSFFNSVFPGIQSEKYNQNIGALITEWNRKSLKISPDFINNFSGSVIVIDEMQRLYSTLGLNTYGFSVACVSKIAKKHNIKMLFLTGTMINSSLGEITDIINIISDEPKFYVREDFCKQSEVLDGINVWRLKRNSVSTIHELLKNNFMYYNQQASLKKVGSSQERVMLYNSTMELVKHGIYFPSFASDEESRKHGYHHYMELSMNSTLKCLSFPKVRNFPHEIHVGNSVVSDDFDFSSKYDNKSSAIPMIIYSVELDESGFQRKKYEEYIRQNIRKSEGSNLLFDSEDISSENIVHIHDAFIPPKSEWINHGIIDVNGRLWGKFLSINKIGKYSAIGRELCILVINNAFNNEKTIIYHNKLNSFGINQYAAILEYNGCIKFGNNPIDNSLCKFCRKTYEQHLMKLDERVKNEVCNKFIGIYYDTLTGELSQSERDGLTNNIFNNPNNITGNSICIMFVSDVAYSGVSFFNTQNIIIASRVPNISKWKQIYARIIRTRSHVLLPPQRQYAKVYTFVINLKDETKKYPQLKKYTIGTRYYKLKEILNNDIEEFTIGLSKKCISEILTHEPKK